MIHHFLLASDFDRSLRFDDSGRLRDERPGIAATPGPHLVVAR